MFAGQGVNLDRAHKDMTSPEVEKQLDDNRTLAKAIGVDGTPSFVIGQKMIGGFLEDDILAAVKADGAHSTTAKAANP